MLGMNLTPAQAQATASAWASAELVAISITSATATASDGDFVDITWPTTRVDAAHRTVVPFCGLRSIVSQRDTRQAVPRRTMKTIVSPEGST